MTSELIVTGFESIMSRKPDEMLNMVGAWETLKSISSQEWGDGELRAQGESGLKSC